MVKINHTHPDGKVCYTSDNLHERIGKIFTIAGKEFIAMWNGYCAMWSVYNTETGYEIASFRQEFYEDFMKRFEIGEMVDDPECV